MFRKIVTELAYSPALAGSLGSYIKQLRDERSRRQIGLIFVILAVIVQLFTTLFPPESANANNPAVFIDGGVQSIGEYLSYYDQNTKGVKDLLTSLGIVRSDIEAAKQLALPSSDEASIWSMQNNRSEQSVAYSFQTANGKIGAAFYQPFDSLGYASEAFVGTAAQSGKWFAIIKESGSLVTQTKATPGCSPWFSTSFSPSPAGSQSGSRLCSPYLEPSLSARTIMPNTPTTASIVANTSDRIAYTLSVTNKGDVSASVMPSINLEDLLEYSRILDNGGGEYDYDTKMITWPATAIGPQESVDRDFIIQLLPTTPSTARGQYISASYDCVIQASFGNSISIPVKCPVVKTVERLTNSLVETSKTVSLIFAASLLAISFYLYARSRQLLTELYIIRHNHLGGV